MPGSVINSCLLAELMSINSAFFEALPAFFSDFSDLGNGSVFFPVVFVWLNAEPVERRSQGIQQTDLPAFCFSLAELLRIKFINAYWPHAIAHQWQLRAFVHHENSAQRGDCGVRDRAGSALGMPAPWRFLPSARRPWPA